MTTAKPNLGDFPGPTVPKWFQSLQYTRSPIRHWERLHADFGDMGIGRFTAYGEIVWLSSPADIREVLLADPKFVHAGEAVRFLEPILGSRSMLILDEDEHLHKRRLILPAFHGDALSALAPIIQAAVDAEVARWPVGEEFALLPHMKSLSLEVILRTVFGLNEPTEFEHVRTVISDLVSSFHLVIWGSRWRRRPWALFERRKAAADVAVLEMISTRRKEPLVAERPDVLSRMLAAQSGDLPQLSDIELRDDLMTLLIAGHETTSVALTWAIGLLARNPTVVEHLRVEQLSGDESYLQAVIKECLRLRPIVPFTGRTLTTEMTIRGHRLPPGTKLWIPILLVHMLPKYYPDPHTFKPERFVEGSPEPYTWLPFGGGIRRCIGAGLANLEMQKVISTIASSVHLRTIVAPLEKERANGVTLVPRHGGRITIEAIQKRPRQEATT